MLFSKPTPNGTGITIYGQASELDLLYGVIHELAETLDEYEEDKKGKHQLLMCFAYEVRKAISGDAIKQEFVIKGNDGFVTHYGFSVVWIDVLLFTNILRYQNAFIIDNKRHQALLFNLEMAIESALIEYDEEGAIEIIPLIGKGIDIRTKYIFLIYKHAHWTFISTIPSSPRFREIPLLINQFFNRSTKYHKVLIKKIEKGAKESNSRGVDMELGEEDFPEIIW